jgi:hypothetical protein
MQSRLQYILHSVRFTFWINGYENDRAFTFRFETLLRELQSTGHRQ